MHKSRQKLKRVNRQDQGSDVTINDFANSSVSGGCGRLKKNALHHVTDEVKQLNISEDDRLWDEKLEDLEPVIGDDDDSFRKRPGRRKRKTTLECESSRGGLDYPIDVWFLISDYLKPEDVGTFAAICRSSYAVVNSAKFWFSLYKRFYREVDGMPEVLRPACMVRRYGLRALVIRSLYFFYPPFTSSYQTRLESDPHKVVGRHCVVSWSQKLKGKQQWVYSFKLKDMKTAGHGRKPAKPKPNLLEMLDDIHANVDDGCKVLQVKANNYYPVPMVTGQILIDCTLKMAADFGSYCMTLQFGSGPSTYQARTVTLSSVSNTRVLDWWHPAFSHSEQLHGGLFGSLLPSSWELSSELY